MLKWYVARILSNRVWMKILFQKNLSKSSHSWNVCFVLSLSTFSDFIRFKSHFVNVTMCWRWFVLVCICREPQVVDFWSDPLERVWNASSTLERGESCGKTTFKIYPEAKLVECLTKQMCSYDVSTFEFINNKIIIDQCFILISHMYSKPFLLC